MNKFKNDPYIARTLTCILISKFLKLTLVHRITSVNMEESMHAQEVHCDKNTLDVISNQIFFFSVFILDIV